MEAEIVKVEPVRQQGRALITREQLDAERAQRQLLGEYVKACMVEGNDYGKIPGTDKPTLLKPGAEKLVALFHCTPKYALVRRHTREDYESGFFAYMFRVRIYGPHGAVLAEGYGSANSREERYRWRSANRKCPACGKEAIIQGKAEYGGGWLCFKKKDGCGAKYGAEDTAITGQSAGRVENPGIHDLANTILKMAKKRALVDGSIALARCSDMFTQDVEDFAGGEPVPEAPPQETKPGKGKASVVDPERMRAASEAPGQPAEQPSAVEAKKRGPDPLFVVVFGPHKGTPLLEMGVEQLRESIKLGKAKLEESPKANWAKDVAANVAQMEIALNTLQVEPEKSEHVEPLTEETAPKVDRRKVYVAFGKYSAKKIAALADQELGDALSDVQILMDSAEAKQWDRNKRKQAANVLWLLDLEMKKREAEHDKREQDRIRAEHKGA